jgi:hypothetical protein
VNPNVRLTDLGPRPRVNRALDDLTWGYESPTFEALGLRFRIQTTDRDLGEYLGSVLAPLASSGPAAHTYTILEATIGDRRRHRIYIDGHRLLSAEAPGMVVATFLWHINTAVVDTSAAWLLLHASAAELDGHTVVMVAPMESGKTTLVAGLVRAGLRYVTDEAVAIAPDTGLVHPFHKPLSIGPGSFDVLADLAPTVAADVAPYLSYQWNVAVDGIRPDALAGVSRPAVIVMPAYNPNASTELAPASRGETLVAAATNSFNLRTHGEDGFHLLADVVSKCACFRLTVNDLDEAVEAVIDALSTTTGGIPHEAAGVNAG